MTKAFSFDLWGTLIRSNPQFKPEKSALIRDFFRLDRTDEQIHQAFVRADLILDNLQENFCLQPDLLTAWGVVLNEIGLKKSEPEEIKNFLNLYHRKFLEFPPMFFDEVADLFDKLKRINDLELFVLSNTILVVGEVLDLYLQNTPLKNLKTFYSDRHFAKPDRRAFELLPVKPLVHIGDNLVTDGACQKFGIEFFQVHRNGKNLMDFWEFIKPRL
jgi:putative hydrolase of the HAD superfamily